MSYTSELDPGSMSILRIMLHAYYDIDFLLREGFDTTVNECSMDGVKDTIQELKDYLVNEGGINFMTED